MYSTPYQVQNVLAQTMTTGSAGGLSNSSPPQPLKLSQIGTQMAPALYTEDVVNYYIKLADAHIDAALSQMYAVPLPELCDLQMQLSADIDEYATTISVIRWNNLGPYETLYLTNGTVSDRIEIESIDCHLGYITPITMPLNLYSANCTRVLRISVPQPIPYLSARLACAGLFDKYFASQQEPGKTEYGQKLRELVDIELNNIREGRTILNGVKRVGWRFANPNLVDRYALKGHIESDGTRSATGGGR